MRCVKSNRNAKRVFAETLENAREKGRGQRTEGRGQGLHEPAATRLPQPVPAIYHIDAYRIRDDDEFRESAAWWLESLGYEVRTFAGPTGRNTTVRECVNAGDPTRRLGS